MGRKAVQTSSGDKPKKAKRTPPALTAEGRENQLISLAYDLVEQRLRDGSATSQETTHFLKMGSLKERKELEIMEKQKVLLDAKAEALASTKRIEELYSNAIEAMKAYHGTPSDANEEE